MLETILIVAAVALVGMLVFKILKKAMGLAFVVATVIGVFLLIAGFFVVQDALEFKDKFSSSKNLFVLADNGTYKEAVIFDPNATETISDYNVEGLKGKLQAGNYSEEYYKVIIIQKRALENVTGINFGLGNMSGETIVEAIYSEDPIAHAAQNSNLGLAQGEIEQRLRNGYTADEFRTRLFGAALMKIIGNSPMNIITEMQNENIIIKPETLLFQTIDYIPLGAFGAADDLNGADAGQDEILEGQG